MTNTTLIPASRVPITDPRTGLISREWYRYLYDQFARLVGIAGLEPLFVTASAQLDDVNRAIIATTSGITITLPKASIARVSGEWGISMGVAGTITVTTQGGDTFPAPSSANETSVIYTQRGESYTFRCVSGTRWRIE